ncbi:MAG TPA: hypothetical protein VGJ84_16410, partial [Polyangiaceae bacterium]
HEKIAHKKSTDSAAEDLQLALDEGVTSPADILAIFSPDHCVRYLDHKRLWAFLTEEEYWSPTKAESDPERAASRTTFTLENALREKLLTLEDFADGITFETLADHLPADQLRRAVRHALTGGRSGKPLTEASLLEVVPLRNLVGYLPQHIIWDGAVVPHVAQPCGFIDKSDAAPPQARAQSTEPISAASEAEDSSKAAKPAKKRAATPVTATAPSIGRDAVLQSAPPPSPPPPSSKASWEEPEPARREPAPVSRAASTERAPQDETRRKVTERLTALDRLPPNHQHLSTPILLSIESMYAELLNCADDGSREECIRESFPNENHLRIALLALIELLDPSIDVNDPLIRDAEIDSLVKVVLFEERHRYEQSRSQPPTSAAPRRPPSGPPPPLPPPPPPLPRTGAAAPPPLPPPPDLKR